MDALLSDDARHQSIEVCIKVALKGLDYLQTLQIDHNNPNALSHLQSDLIGLSILYGQLDECFPGVGWDQAAMKSLSKVVEIIQTCDAGGTGVFGGIIGVGYAVWFLSKSGERYQNLSKSIDALIIDAADSKLSDTSNFREGRFSSDFDAISGLAGICGLLLLRQETSIFDIKLQAVIDRLAELVTNDDGIPRLRVTEEKAVGSLTRHFVDGFVDCGLSHGLPGPVAALSLSILHGYHNTLVETCLYSSVQWLLDQRTNDNWGANWPAAVSLASLQSRTFDSSLVSRQKPTKTAWCYGAPGIANTLWLAGAALKDTSLKSYAVDVMESALAKPIGKRYINSYGTFCHGVSGLLHIVHHFYLRTGSHLFKQHATLLLEQTLTHYSDSSVSGFERVDYNGSSSQDFGILDGAAGVALVLLTLTFPEQQNWTRMFLVD